MLEPPFCFCFYFRFLAVPVSRWMWKSQLTRLIRAMFLLDSIWHPRANTLAPVCKWSINKKEEGWKRERVSTCINFCLCFSLNNKAHEHIYSNKIIVILHRRFLLSCLCVLAIQFFSWNQLYVPRRVHLNLEYDMIPSCCTISGSVGRG